MSEPGGDPEFVAGFERAKKYGAPKIQRPDPVLLLAMSLTEEPHLVGCRARLAAEGAVAVECEHGHDACPICDPCTCAELRAIAAGIYIGKPDRKRCRDCWTEEPHSAADHAAAIARGPR